MRKVFFNLLPAFAAILLSLASFDAMGQVIYGGVFNSVTRQRLHDVKVELMDKHYVTLDSMRNSPNNRIADRPSAWFFDMENRPAQPYILRFKAEGYETQDVPVDSFTFRRREVARFIADVYMEKAIKHKALGEVTVKATKVKIYTRGDTVVYNADAFQLAEGSMLDALIRQLPGVELKDDGRILVNGRYVENLLLNGEDFFKGEPSVMLENLPAYAVKDVKVYDKDGKLSEFLGRKTGDEELVMDVRLKREYSVGWLANAEGAYGTEERYRARLFGLRFTPHTRFSAFANFNNMNENRQPGYNGEWSPAQLTGGLRSNKNFGVNYMVNEKDGKYKLNGSASYMHYDTDVRSQTTGVNFLPDGDTYFKEAHEQFFCQTWFNTSHTFQFTWDKVFLNLQPSFNWGKWDDRNTYLSGTFNTDPEPYASGNLLDSLASPEAGDLMRRIAINRSKTDQSNKGNKTNAAFSAYSAIKSGLGNDNLNLYTNVRYNDYEQRWYEHYRLDYPAGGGQTDYRNKYTNDDGPIRDLNLNAGGEYWLWFPHNLAVAPGYNYHWHDNTKRYELYRLDELAGWGEDGDHPLGMLPSEVELLQQTLDAPNSYWSYLTDYSHRGSLYAKWEGKPRTSGEGTWWYVEARLPLMYVWQTLDYQRERLDTTVSRRHVMFEPSFRVYGRWHNFQRGIDIRYNKSVSFPSMTSFIDIRSTDDPLNIRLSNTGLKNSHQHNISVYYYLNSNRKQRYFNTYWSYSITQDAVAQGYVYDKATGVRTYRPENVNGNYNIGGNVNYSMPLDKARRLTLNSRLWSRLQLGGPHRRDGRHGTAPQHRADLQLGRKPQHGICLPQGRESGRESPLHVELPDRQPRRLHAPQHLRLQLRPDSTGRTAMGPAIQHRPDPVQPQGLRRKQHEHGRHRMERHPVEETFQKPRDALPRWLRHPRAAFQRHPDTERTGTLRDVAQRHPQLCHAAPCLQSGHQTGQTERRINRNLYTKIIRRRNVFRSAPNDFPIYGKRFSVCRRFFSKA